MSQNPQRGASPKSTRPSLAKDEVLEKPWKYVGYKGYTKFLTADDDAFILRRFSSLNVRISIVLLERELTELDEAHSRREAQDFHNGRLRSDLPARKVLTTLIGEKLQRYSELRES